jgi:hypothetical protein
MKEMYTKATVAISAFTAEDVIRTSDTSSSQGGQQMI